MLSVTAIIKEHVFNQNQINVWVGAYIAQTFACVFGFLAKALLPFEVHNDTNVCRHLYSRIMTVKWAQCAFSYVHMYDTFLYIYH